MFRKNLAFSGSMVGLLWLSGPGTGMGAPGNYPPFTTNEPVSSCELFDIPLEKANQSDENLEYIYGDVRIKVFMETHSLQLLSSSNQQLLAPVRFFGVTIAFEGVKTGDINQDSIPDFIVIAGSGGNGLAASYAELTLILSSEEGYAATAVETRSPSPSDFFHWANGEECFLVQTTFISAPDETTSDGRYHNFWVHNIFSFAGASVVPANEKFTGFPKWIWYTYKPNSKPSTKLLTEVEKNQLWEERDEGRVEPSELYSE